MKSLVVPTLLALALAAAAPAQVHRDPEVGYQINTPRDYEPIANPGNLASKYCMAAFRATKPLSTKEGYNYFFTIYCFLFPSQQNVVTTGERERRDESPSEDGSRSIEDFIKTYFNRVYLNFDELAKDQIQGFYFGSPEEKSIGGLDVTLKDMHFEKLANLEQRWLVALFNVKGDQFAVVQTCPTERYDKHRAQMLSTLNSFRVLDKDKGLTLKEMKPPVTVAKAGALTPEERKLPIAERNKVILRKAEEVLEQKLAELERGWTSMRTPHYLILSHVDRGFTQKIANQAEAAHSWLEETFGDIGEGVVAPGVIRIYEDAKDRGPQERTLTEAGAMAIQEIVILKRSEWGDPKEAQWDITVEIIDKWFSYKNGELWDRMPTWMTSGIVQYLVSASLKGRKLVFSADVDEKTMLKEAFVRDRLADKKGENANNVKPLKELVTMTRHERQGGSWAEYWFFRYQSGSFLRFLFDGPGKGLKQTKGIIPEYVKHLLDELEVVEKKLEEEREARRAARDAQSQMSEEERLKAEDEEYQRRRKTAVDAVAKEMLERIYEKTFGAFTEKDWEFIQSRWEKFAGK